MLLVFALTLFVSAFLLFLVEPMVGKMVTPLLGGTPAVWNTCMVFFQALLLAGYAYAHASTAWLGARKQAALHALVLLVPLAFFPLAVDRGRAAGADRDPVLTVLLLLTLSVGVPFLVVSTSAPLLQRWFAGTGHPAARDPYFLYGASNLGSMLALLGYPTLVEPWLSLAEQRWLWGIGYGVLALLTAGCAVCLWRSKPAPEAAGGPVAGKSDSPVTFTDRPSAGRGRGPQHVRATPPSKKPTPVPAAPLDDRVTAARRLRWVVLAAVPSSLMLGATTYMTTDIAAIPLLWVLPLALYLLSFILVFSKSSEALQSVAVSVATLAGLAAVAWLVPTYFPSQKFPWIGPAVWLGCAGGALLSLRLLFVRDARLLHRSFVLSVPLLILLLLFNMLSEGGRPSNIGLAIALHLATLFAVAMVCHGELALDRPSPRHLTGFFLWMSVGGVVGGLFNALLAPVLFNGIVEYQLALVAACFLVPPLTTLAKEGGGSWNLTADLVLLALFVLIGGLLLGLRLRDGDLDFTALYGRAGAWAAAALLGGLALGLGRAWRDPKRSPASYLDVALPLALALLAVGLGWGLYANVVWRRVNGFASSIGMERPERLYHVLMYGVPAVLCYTFVERPVRFGLSVGALALAAATCGVVLNRVEFQDRSFFGVLKVEKDPSWNPSVPDQLESVSLMHGTTLHGIQLRSAADPEADLRWRQQPMTYYHRTGPVGNVFGVYNTDPSRPFGVIGLGTGTMANYALSPDPAAKGAVGAAAGIMAARAAPRGQHVTFYDIDPVVRGISFDSDRFFTYIADARARGAEPELVMGDARLTMERQELRDDQKYGLLIIDAFSSDAIPVHLITREALELYLDRLRPDGIVLFHVSNRYLDLRPVLANLAREEKLTGYAYADDREKSNAPSQTGRFPSTWVALARKPEHLDRLLRQPAWGEIQPTLKSATLLAGFVKAPWEALKPDPKVGVWTDDYSNLLSVFNWGR
jgi:hypothetical protein